MHAQAPSYVKSKWKRLRAKWQKSNGALKTRPTGSVKGVIGGNNRDYKDGNHRRARFNSPLDIKIAIHDDHTYNYTMNGRTRTISDAYAIVADDRNGALRRLDLDISSNGQLNGVVRAVGIVGSGIDEDPPLQWDTSIKNAQKSCNEQLTKSKERDAKVKQRRLRECAKYGVLTVNPGYSQCKASSVWDDNAIGTRHGTGRLDSQQAWSAKRNKGGEWWQVDLGSDKPIAGVEPAMVHLQILNQPSHAGVVTQGRTNHDQFVKSYKVKVSSDGNRWIDVDGNDALAQPASLMMYSRRRQDLHGKQCCK